MHIAIKAPTDTEDA